MRHVYGPPARPGRLGARGFGTGFPGRGSLAMSLLIGAGLPGARLLGARRLGVRLAGMRQGVRGPGS